MTSSGYSTRATRSSPPGRDSWSFVDRLPDGPETVLTAYRRIVVGAHGSPTSEVAEEVAARLAHQLGAEMILIHVSDDTVKGEDILRSAAVRARALGVEAQTVHRKGDVAESIVGAAAELHADLLVIGDHGMGRRAVSASVAFPARWPITHPSTSWWLGRNTPLGSTPTAGF